MKVWWSNTYPVATGGVEDEELQKALRPLMEEATERIAFAMAYAGALPNGGITLSDSHLMAGMCVERMREFFNKPKT